MLYVCTSTSPFLCASSAVAMVLLLLLLLPDAALHLWVDGALLRHSKCTIYSGDDMWWAMHLILLGIASSLDPCV